MSQLHVVVGAGQIGPKLARILSSRGLRVRMVRRSRAAAPAGIESMHGDVTDAAFADEAFRGASVVYNCANPPRYDRWEEFLPPLVRAVTEGAARAGARLVMLANLYMYGLPEGGILREDSPVAPRSKKGELRAMLAGELLEADRRGDIHVAIGRASDFVGPNAERSVVFNPRFFSQLEKGKAVDVVGNPDVPHAHSYMQDVAEGLAVLGTDERSWGNVWHLPVAWNGTNRELVERFAARLGVKSHVRAIPRWAIRLLGIVNGQIGAMTEMMYQWESPFIVDDARFRRVFGVEPTPIDTVVRETLAAAGGTVAA